MDPLPTNICQLKMIPVYLFIHSYTSPDLLISAAIHLHAPLDPFHTMIHLPFDPLPSWAGPGHAWWVGFGAGWGQMTSAIAWGQWCLVHMESTGRMAMLGTGTEPSDINQTQSYQWYISLGMEGTNQSPFNGTGYIHTKGIRCTFNNLY